MNLQQSVNHLPLLRTALTLIAGIMAGEAWGELLPLWAWLGLAGMSIVTATVIGKHREWQQGACILVCTAFLGVALMTHANRRSRPVSTAGDVDYSAVVMSEPVVRGRTVQCDLTILGLNGSPLRRPLSVKAAILRDTAHPRRPQLHLGDGLRARSALHVPQTYHTDSHFDYARWLRTHGFRARTFIHDLHWQPEAVDRSRLPAFDRLRLRAMRLRQRVLAQYRGIGLDDQQLAIVAAMTLGDRSLVSRATKELYSVSGASHILALSGLHLGIIYGLLTLFFGLGHRRLWLSQIIIMATIWAYVLLVGLPPSAIRSATMLTVCALCIVVGRQPVSVNTLSLAALVMLATHPPLLYDVGFRMSFMAVLAILVYYVPIARLLTLRNPLARTIWQMAVVSVAAQIGTAPLVIYYFGRFSCYFLLTNFVVIPAAVCILYGTVMVLLTAPVPLAQKLLAGMLVHLVTLLNASLAAFARLPWASIEGIRLSATQLCLLYAIIGSVSVIIFYGWKIRSQKRLEAFYRQ